MDFILHGMTGALPFWASSVKILRRWWVLTAVWVMGAFPDLVHVLDWFYGTGWTYHLWSHEYHWWYWLMLGLPTLHMWIDSFWHLSNGMWKWWGLPVDIAMYFILAMFVWLRNFFWSAQTGGENDS